MNESIAYLVLNSIRKLPNKSLIAFITWVLIGICYNKFKIIKSYYFYKVKERESKRKFIFELSNNI